MRGAGIPGSSPDNKFMEKKIKYQIKNRWTDKIIIEGTAKSLKELVVKNKANLWGADLQGANLQRADLQGADLRGANLWGTNLRGVKITTTQKEDLFRSLGIVIE